jgi:hypothetical protein
MKRKAELLARMELWNPSTVVLMSIPTPSWHGLGELKREVISEDFQIKERRIAFSDRLNIVPSHLITC